MTQLCPCFEKSCNKTEYDSLEVFYTLSDRVKLSSSELMMNRKPWVKSQNTFGVHMNREVLSICPFCEGRLRFHGHHVLI